MSSIKGIQKTVILLAMLVISTVHAQEKTISGNVTDSGGLPIPGVSVIIKGTTTGTTTDFDGFYQLKGSYTDTSIVVFSYIGMTTVERLVGTEDEINVVLEEDLQMLNEVVVVGYGTQEKKDITGSVSIVDSESFESRPNTQVGSLLQGQSAGVQVTSNSGKPSAGFSIRIRGTNSINAGSEPLYVVDGVPTTDTRSINPSDIDSISILKDASSTAIYGAQGANGVVLITTKRGTTDKPKISLDTYTGFNEVWKTISVLNGEQYRDLMTEMGLTTDWDSYTERTDWQDEIFQSGFSQNYQLSLSGRSDGTNYYVSAGYVSQEGAIRSSELDRSNFKINLDQKVTDWLKIGTRIAYTSYRDVDITDNTNVNSGGVLLGALTTPSIIGIYNEDGSFTSNPFQNWENPLSSTDGSEREYNSQRLLGNIYLDATFLKDFTYRFNYGIDNSNGIYDFFLDPFRTGYGRALNGQSINTTNSTKYYIVENTLNYKKNINKHNIEVLLGSVNQKYLWENSSIETRNFASESVTTPNGGSEIFGASATKSEKSNTSFISRLNYAFDDKYLLTANFRADGSSTFGPDERWGYFPSFSLGWRVSNENFLENVDFISDLKIRAGWGIVGNDQIGNYAYLGTVGSGANYPIGGVAQPGTYPGTIENLSLKWEESEQTNVGIDIQFLDNRIGFTADAYVKNTSDLLLNAPLPTSTGFSSAIQNIGELQNKGLEFTLNTKNILSDKFEWSSGFNISFNENEVTNLVGQELLQGSIAGRGEATLVKEGLPLGTLYGYIFGGVDPTTGNAYYINQNGESTFTPDADDRVIIGDANPDFFYSVTNTISYKGFDLFVFLQGSQGNDILNATRIELEGMSDPKNQSTEVLNRWRQPGDITDIPRSSFGNTDNSRISTRFVEDGSYLRFKAITLSYNFPESMIQHAKLSALKLYVTGENMFTITNYSGYDPEVNSFGSSNTVRGIDFGTYPQTRNLIFGMSVTF
ncbi:SusC/RagA family TonB-linked outer membrane protein [Winogradskyella sediminis]|uniref:SusC/RagA family TonB-linked outer membrane protein n=1 Tax=Winogradskyella sediminis TaxID=1382466 RepID=UPI000E2717F3|nr:TonB-dependent receptor [Winogradskyella sediminis]REG90117.1 TonB-linked SusC/RagA family outer membrane protein [Winogradskyella sediminis]